MVWKAGWMSQRNGTVSSTNIEYLYGRIQEQQNWVRDSYHWIMHERYSWVSIFDKSLSQNRYRDITTCSQKILQHFTFRFNSANFFFNSAYLFQFSMASVWIFEVGWYITDWLIQASSFVCSCFCLVCEHIIKMEKCIKPKNIGKNVQSFYWCDILEVQHTRMRKNERKRHRWDL